MDRHDSSLVLWIFLFIVSISTLLFLCLSDETEARGASVSINVTYGDDVLQEHEPSVAVDALKNSSEVMSGSGVETERKVYSQHSLLWLSVYLLILAIFFRGFLFIHNGFR